LETNFTIAMHVLNHKNLRNFFS